MKLKVTKNKKALVTCVFKELRTEIKKGFDFRIRDFFNDESGIPMITFSSEQKSEISKRQDKLQEKFKHLKDTLKGINNAIYSSDDDVKIEMDDDDGKDIAKALTNLKEFYELFQEAVLSTIEQSEKEESIIDAKVEEIRTMSRFVQISVFNPYTTNLISEENQKPSIRTKLIEFMEITKDIDFVLSKIKK